MDPALALKATQSQTMPPVTMDEVYDSEPADLGIDSDDTEKAVAMRRLWLTLRGVSQVRHLHGCWLLDDAIGHRQEKP